MFSQVTGQTNIASFLIRETKEGRVPHALLFRGPAGSGKLALAVSFAQYLLCRQPDVSDACGTCPSCRLSTHFAHPDLHFVFPIIRYKSAESSVCDVYMETWRKRLESGLYFRFTTSPLATPAVLAYMKHASMSGRMACLVPFSVTKLLSCCAGMVIVTVW